MESIFVLSIFAMENKLTQIKTKTLKNEKTNFNCICNCSFSSL